MVNFHGITFTRRGRPWYNGREVNDVKKMLLAALLLLLVMLPAQAATFTDALGREVTLSDTPTRAVALLGSYGKVWLEAGGTLVGTTEDAIDETAEALGIANLGSHSEPSMELLFGLEPDFVILSADAAAHPAIGEVLEAASIPYGYFSMETWQGYMDMLKTFTDLTGRADLWENAEKSVRSSIEATIADAQARPEYGNQTALLLRAYVTSVKAKGSEGTVAGPMLKEMGLVNIADGDSALSENLTMEAILVADPDWIFVVTMGSDQEGAARMLEETLLTNPAWVTLTAVREGRYVVLDRELFQLRPNGRWAEAYKELYKLIYEE